MKILTWKICYSFRSRPNAKTLFLRPERGSENGDVQKKNFDLKIELELRTPRWMSSWPTLLGRSSPYSSQQTVSIHMNRSSSLDSFNHGRGKRMKDSNRRLKSRLQCCSGVPILVIDERFHQ
jgi:hypothetical protein